jgi:hypothetical protein
VPFRALPHIFPDDGAVCCSLQQDEAGDNGEGDHDRQATQRSCQGFTSRVLTLGPARSEFVCQEQPDRDEHEDDVDQG